MEQVVASSDCERDRGALWLVTMVAALGYFVDVYDIIIFSVVRGLSLRALGLSGQELLTTGAFLLNVQMAGMLVGGLIWGILGDKRGRLAILFGSILLYSLANIGNAFVSSVSAYAWLRLVAGIGLAGELGAGVTLVSEIASRSARGYATTIVTTLGVSGGLAAAFVGGKVAWSTAYLFGGVAGLLVLVLRLGVRESRLFESAAKQEVPKGDFRILLRSPERFLRYLGCVCVGVPIWFVLGIVVTFAPELGAELGDAHVTAGVALAHYTVGNVIGSFTSGLLSQWLRSRKRSLLLFLALSSAACGELLMAREMAAQTYYWWCLFIGFSLGYWSVLATTAAEQFGTNLRATVATTVPNFVRGTTLPITFAFNTLQQHLGVIAGARLVGLVCLVLAVASVFRLRETFARDLDFLEMED